MDIIFKTRKQLPALVIQLKKQEPTWILRTHSMKLYYCRSQQDFGIQLLEKEKELP